MNLNELREKRNKLMADAAALMQGDVTTEVRAKFDTMLADVTVIDGDLSRLEAIAAEQRAYRPQPGAGNVETGETRDAQVKASFRNYLRTGVVESRDLSAAGNGAVAVPQVFNPYIFEAQKSYGDIYNLVNIIKTDNGDPMKLVLDDDTSNGLTNVTVGTDVSETDPTLTGKLLQVDTFTTGVVKVDNGLLSDAGFDVESWLRDKFAMRFFRGASGLIYSGDGGNVASLASAFTAGFTSSVTAKVGYVDFATAIGTLDPAYQANAVWAMSNSTLASVIGLSDANQRPLFLPFMDGGAAGFVGTILGKPVKLVTQMPAVATGNVAVLFGDFKAGYSFRVQNPGLSVIRLTERYAAAYQTGFVGFTRVGGASTIASSSLPPVIAITVK